MAILIDEKARAAIARRRAGGRDATLFLRLERFRGRGGPLVSYPWDLVAGWAPRAWPESDLTVRSVGDVVVCVDTRVARYTHWHDVTISAWRVGPIDLLTVDPYVVLEMQAWERTHPAIEDRSTA